METLLIVLLVVFVLGGGGGDTLVTAEISASWGSRFLPVH